MSETRAEANQVLKSAVVPVLRSMGFKGSLPHFRRIGPAKIDLLTFQFDKYGGGFVVEIAKCEASGIVMYWGEKIPPNKVTAHHVSSPRPRLAPNGQGPDHWFRYDGGRSLDELASEVVSLLESQAEPWWNDA